jgi:KaiC/GvpD/RAD55 family RecA-like ATPase
MYQDHEAHIKVHMAAMQDPQIQQLIGQNPQVNQIMGAMSAHIAEHTAFAYRNKIEEAMGIELPMPDEEMSPDIEVQVSRLVAQAAQQVLQNSQNQVAQEQAAQQAQQMAADPVIQLQQKELEIKEREQSMKEQKAMADVQLEQQRVEIEKQRVEGELYAKGMQLSSSVVQKDKEMRAKQYAEGVRMGVNASANSRKGPAK